MLHNLILIIYILGVMIPGLESIRNQILSVFQNLMILAKIDFCTVILESILGTGIDSKIRYFVMAMISIPIPEKKDS